MAWPATPGAGRVRGHPDLGRRPRATGRPSRSTGLGARLQDRARSAFTAGRHHGQRAGSRSARPPARRFCVGTVSLMPADNVEGFRADTLRAAARAGLRRSTAGRAAISSAATTGATASATATSARRARTRPGRASSTTTSASTSSCDFCRLARRPSPTSPSTAAWATCSRRPTQVEYVNGAATTPHGQAAGEERPRRAASSVEFWCDRQRDVRRLAARPHAAGEVRREAQPVRPARCAAKDPRDQADRASGDVGPVERGDAGQARAEHMDYIERALLLSRSRRG
ncbi:MAG: hypothetical protein MZV63_06265 [Marinilabiliales bacterium]|nr:hypothetical protein [Marinilabiliales bacterium]